VSFPAASTSNCSASESGACFAGFSDNVDRPILNCIMRALTTCDEAELDEICERARRASQVA
jgi:hypothetical protein